MDQLESDRTNDPGRPKAIKIIGGALLGAVLFYLTGSILSAVGFHLWAMTMDDPGPYVPTDACLFGIIFCGPLVAIAGAVTGAIVGAKRTKKPA